jgi:hypothetical protein
MALGSTQPLREMSIRNLPRGKGRPEHKADNLIAICEQTVYKMWNPLRFTNLWASMPVTGIDLLLFVPHVPSPFTFPHL